MVRLIVLFCLQILALSSYSQDFGCFEVREGNYDIIYERQKQSSIVKDSVFWIKYQVNKLSDGYHKIPLNKYQTKMEGEISDGKRTGIWKLYETDGYWHRGFEQIHIVSYLNDKKEGQYTVISTNYQDTMILLKGSYKDDLRDGEFVYFDKDTIIRSIDNYSKGKRQGIFVTYNISKNNHEISSISFYNNDLEDGTNISFYNNSKLLARIYEYSEGINTGEIDVNKNGEIKTSKYKFKKPNDTALDIKNNYLISDKYGDLSEEYYKKQDSGRVKFEGRIINMGHRKFRDSIWTYYYKSGEIRARINYINGKKSGISRYYDTSGKLRRTEVLFDNGSTYNIFDGDTVNVIDNHGLKQGKWISFKEHFTYNENNCEDNPESIRFYKNNMPIGTWDITKYGYRYKYVWQDTSLAYRYTFYNNKIIEEGELIDMTYKFGRWKEYDGDKGFLRTEGNYYLDRKIGKWIVYKKKGKIKKVIDYK